MERYQVQNNVCLNDFFGSWKEFFFKPPNITYGNHIQRNRKKAKCENFLGHMVKNEKTVQIDYVFPSKNWGIGFF